MPAAHPLANFGWAMMSELKKAEIKRKAKKRKEAKRREEKGQEDPNAVTPLVDQLWDTISLFL